MPVQFPVPCIAVGYSIDSSLNQVTLAERWTHGQWVIQPTPSPGATDSGGPRLYAVDCLAADDCTAVGTYEPLSAGPNATLVEQWNGASWAVVPSPDPLGATYSVLGGVACFSRSRCAAVGDYLDASGNEFMLAEGWDGHQWTIRSTPEPAGATQSWLASVSCASASACVAVGGVMTSDTAFTTIAEGWNGHSWAIEATRSLSQAQLSGVSCPTLNECTAVGDKEEGSGNSATLAEQWNGHIWKIDSTPSPRGRTLAELTAASCVTPAVCEAAGFSLNASGDAFTLAEASTT